MKLSFSSMCAAPRVTAVRQALAEPQRVCVWSDQSERNAPEQKQLQTQQCNVLWLAVVTAGQHAENLPEQKAATFQRHQSKASLQMPLLGFLLTSDWCFQLRLFKGLQPPCSLCCAVWACEISQAEQCQGRGLSALKISEVHCRNPYHSGNDSPLSWCLILVKEMLSLLMQTNS